MGLTPQWIAWQVHIHWRIAWFFHHAGLQVMLRPFNTARPYSFPALRKIVRKQHELVEGEVEPSLDWSKVDNVRLWVDRTAPESWKCKYVGCA